MRIAFFFLVLLSFNSFGQALRSVNFQHWYDPESPLFHLRTVRGPDQWNCFFSLTLRDTSANVNEYEREWSVRSSLADDTGTKLQEDSISRNDSRHWELRGSVSVPLSEEERYLVLTMTDPANNEKKIYYATLPPNYPERFPIVVDGDPVVRRYVRLNATVKPEASEVMYIAHYEDNFPTAPAAFSEALGKVSRGMKIDSSFTLAPGNDFTPSEPGLYLIQRDTSAAEGVAFRLEEDYPRFSKLSNVAEALIYVCTSQEYERIRRANGEKKSFDRVILSITRDAERAKKFMRSYFKRVEAANEFFTSYKEGWKTDRGMIYIVFGQPDEVFRFTDREIWSYKRPEYKTEFVFAKSPSLFDPNNYVLIRNQKYREQWYEVIDLWRNARF